MTREDAAHVLRKMNLIMSRDSLTDTGEQYIDTFRTFACLDGDFTADQLEAIAAWMRDPTIADIKA